MIELLNDYFVSVLQLDVRAFNPVARLFAIYCAPLSRSENRKPMTENCLEVKSTGMSKSNKLGLIAGNGNFPLLVLDAARAQGREVVVAAIKEETWPEVEQRSNSTISSGPRARVFWLSLGDLSKLIDTFKQEGITEAVMAGQVKHKQIFSSIKPDWRLAKILLSLVTRNTDSLIGAVAKELASEGITLVNSTQFLEPLLARSGVLTKRAPTEAELKDITYGRAVGRHLAQYDIGQTVVIAAAACVAVEAMEGTDETILRAGSIISARNEAPNIKADASSALHTA